LRFLAPNLSMSQILHRPLKLFTMSPNSNCNDEPPVPTTREVTRSPSFILGVADGKGKNRGSLTFAGNVSQLKRAGSSRTGLDAQSEDSTLRKTLRESFLLRYSLSPLGLPLKCDGCGDEFSINHALKCKYGGLIILRHNEVTRELIE
jgi:hypothetical protein